MSKLSTWLGAKVKVATVAAAIIPALKSIWQKPFDESKPLLTGAVDTITGSILSDLRTGLRYAPGTITAAVLAEATKRRVPALGIAALALLLSDTESRLTDLDNKVNVPGYIDQVQLLIDKLKRQIEGARL